MVTIKTFLKTWRPVRKPEASLLETRVRENKRKRTYELSFSGNRTDDFKKCSKVYDHCFSKNCARHSNTSESSDVISQAINKTIPAKATRKRRQGYPVD